MTKAIMADFWEFSAYLDFSVGLFNRLRKAGVKDGYGAIAFYNGVFIRKGYARKWGCYGREFASKMQNIAG